ncbi:MAG: transglutaminase domain-containing protein [Rhodospirillales bacterium]|nr:transglutaminase domain-containing protein [Rhodospirillales bacterium]
MTEADLSPYLEQTAVSDPGRFGAVLDQFDPDIRTLPAQVSALMIHPGVAAVLGLPITAEQDLDRRHRTVARLLEHLMARDDGPVAQGRALEKRLGGICRDHAMLGVAVLRHHGIPARMRGGFSRYFTAGFWDDHWVAEVWHAGAWRLVDMQLGPQGLKMCSRSVEPWDVVRDAFVCSPESWLACRRGTVDADHIGVCQIGLTGHWFAATSVVRDAASLACIELLPWDYWSGIDTLANARERLPEFATETDAIADRLLGGGATFENARDVLETVPWIGIPEMVVSYHGSGDPGFEIVTLYAA